MKKNEVSFQVLHSNSQFAGTAQIGSSLAPIVDIGVGSSNDEIYMALPENLRSLFHFHKGPTPLPPTVPAAAIDALETFEYRDDDILIASYPKCGTHWINEVVQLILHDGDPTKLGINHRRVCLELQDAQDVSLADKIKPTVELVKNDPSRRVLMTHLGASYLSKETWTKRIPIIYIFRDPRDAAISLYNFLTSFTHKGVPVLQNIPFDMFLHTFISGEVGFGSWCDHALGYEKLAANGENIIFITYEDMKKDMSSVIKSIANHIGHEVNEKVTADVVANTTVEAMRKNYQEAAKLQDDNSANLSIFINKGAAGKWKTDFSEETWKKLNETFKERVKDTTHAKSYFKDE